MLNLIDTKLRELNIPIDGVADNGDGTYRIDFRPEATDEQRAQAKSVIAGIDFVAEAEQQRLERQLLKKMMRFDAADDEDYSQLRKLRRAEQFVDGLTTAQLKRLIARMLVYILSR